MCIYVYERVCACMYTGLCNSLLHLPCMLGVWEYRQCSQAHRDAALLPRKPCPPIWANSSPSYILLPWKYSHPVVDMNLFRTHSVLLSRIAGTWCCPYVLVFLHRHSQWHCSAIGSCPMLALPSRFPCRGEAVPGAQVSAQVVDAALWCSHDLCQQFLPPVFYRRRNMSWHFPDNRLKWQLVVLPRR